MWTQIQPIRIENERRTIRSERSISTQWIAEYVKNSRRTTFGEQQTVQEGRSWTPAWRCFHQESWAEWWRPRAWWRTGGKNRFDQDSIAFLRKKKCRGFHTLFTCMTDSILILLFTGDLVVDLVEGILHKGDVEGDLLYEETGCGHTVRGLLLLTTRRLYRSLPKDSDKKESDWLMTENSFNLLLFLISSGTTLFDP